MERSPFIYFPPPQSRSMSGLHFLNQARKREIQKDIKVAQGLMCQMTQFIGGLESLANSMLHMLHMPAQFTMMLLIKIIKYVR